MNLSIMHLAFRGSLAWLLAATVACASNGSGSPPGAGSGGGNSGGGNTGGGNTGGGNTGGNGGGGGGNNGGSGGAGGPVEPPDMATDYLFPDVAHTGFDGTHVFKVPLSTNLTNVTWKIDDPAIASITPVATPALYAEYGETWAMVTAKKAGTTKVTATGGGKTVSSMLVVQAYTAANLAAGDKRYNTPDNPTAAQRNACAGCHKLANGADHSPVVLAAYDDDDVLPAITTGVYQDGYQLMVTHTWNLTDAEKQGIMPYLRSLPPRGF